MRGWGGGGAADHSFSISFPPGEVAPHGPQLPVGLGRKLVSQGTLTVTACVLGSNKIQAVQQVWGCSGVCGSIGLYSQGGTHVQQAATRAGMCRLPHGPAAQHN